MKTLITCCCGNRGHAPHLNRIVRVQLGSSRRAGLTPRTHPGPPNAPSPDPALTQNLGMSLPLSLCDESSALLMYKFGLLFVFVCIGDNWETLGYKFNSYMGRCFNRNSSLSCSWHEKLTVCRHTAVTTAEKKKLLEISVLVPFYSFKCCHGSDVFCCLAALW